MVIINDDQSKIIKARLILIRMGLVDIIRPVFFDIFGIVVFIFLLITGIWMLKKKKIPPTWVSVILIVIGVWGLIVDGTIVYLTYLK